MVKVIPQSSVRLESEKVNDFLIAISQQFSKGRIRVVFRGDKLESLFQRLNVPYHPKNLNIEEVLRRLFMVGEKSRYFYNDFSSSRFNIDDIGNDAFRDVFDKIREVARSKKNHHKDFFNDNNSFKEYFQNTSNKSLFVNAITVLTDSQKLIVKNYYLSLLHQLASINYKNKSAFVSTTEDRNVAKQFAEGNSKKELQFVLYAWIPTGMPIRRIFNTSKLPVYTNPPFKRQKEISFFAGILPHFIIGFQLLSGKWFYNPAIYKTDITPNIFLEGLQIDQANFEKVLRTTNYRKYYSDNGKGLTFYDI